MAEHLAGQTRQRVEFDALAGAAERGDSSLLASPDRRRVLADAAQELVRRGLAQLPCGRPGWDFSAHPPLPLWVKRPSRPRAVRAQPGQRAWVAPLAGLSAVQLTTSDHALLNPVNTLLRDEPDAELIPVAERSYQLYDDEKYLHGIERHRLVTRGILDIADHLRARPAPAPLAMYELGPAPWLLIVENSAAFTSLRQILAAWPDRSQVGWLGYGAGDQLVASLPTAADSFRERDHPAAHLMLYADLDLDGLECARQADTRGHAAELPALVPAVGLYQALLTRRIRQVPPAPAERVREAVSWLPPGMATPVADLLISGKVLRQEALPLPVLRAHLDPASPLLPQLRGPLPRVRCGPGQKEDTTVVPGPDLPAADQPMTTEALLHRWPSASMRTELVYGVLLFTGNFDERDAAIAQRTYPGRRVLLNNDGAIEVHPAGSGPARSLLDR
ncbi:MULTISPECIES: hypothetical protein [unclassified Streptomyces]|nr:hypothetical protein [Streptomyces sp. NBC_01761]WSC50937.1 hypothetical protein OG808_00255 [Streptomyces sp. NBC_01761]WSC58584.1 hypothetical protein OG808_44060 [Streptomyces sp. NBC_01761]